MKRIAFITIALVALAVIVASIHSHNTVAATHQSQIRPTPRPELKLRWLSAVTLNKTTTVGGSVDGDITGTVHLVRSAVGNLTINLSIEQSLYTEPAATLPSTVITIPAGSDSATFRIQTLSLVRALSIPCTVRARYGDEHAAAIFTVESTLMHFDINAALGAIGSPTSTRPLTITIWLNAFPATDQTVTLTSSNPIVRFGASGNAQSTASVTFTSASRQRTVQVVASAVTQPTTVTITAKLGAQTLTRQITVRP
jgi:hypothetical protein